MMSVALKQIEAFPDLAGSLYEAGFLSQDQAKVLLREQVKSGRLLEDLVVSLGFLDHRVLEAFLSQHQGVTFFKPEEHFVDPVCLDRFPKESAQKHHVLPLHFEEDTLFVAMRDIHDVLALDAVKRYFPDAKRVQVFAARSEEISHLLEEGYGAEMSLDGILDNLVPGLHVVGQGDSPALLFLEALLRRAVKDQASDIHLEPDHYCVHVRCRIDGVLRHTFSFHKDSWSAICVGTKVMAGMNIAESRLPQSGRFTKKLYGREVDFRCATHPTLHGENIVLRVLDKLYSLKSLDDLGFHAHQIDLLKRQLRSPEGLILLTGPTGSGKTTTLYSMLRYLQATERNIMTLEEPVEYEVRGIRQSAVQDVGGFRFAEGVRSLLRQDPDVIFIGEIRDTETAEMAFRASMTGHLVLSTLHSKDAIGSLQRLQDLGIGPRLLEGNCLSIVAQRLVRRLCRACHDAQEGGCEDCQQTGFKGRVALAEVLEITEALDALIGQGQGRHALLEQAKKEGFSDLYHHGLASIQRGETSMTEVQRVLGIRSHR